MYFPWHFLVDELAAPGLQSHYPVSAGADRGWTGRRSQEECCKSWNQRATGTMKYQYLKARGALNEAVNQRAGRPAQARLSDAVLLDLLIHGAIPAYVLAVMPE